MGLSTLRNASQLCRTLRLWAIRLDVYSAKVRIPVERRHIRQRQSCVLPISYSAVSGVWLANLAAGMISSRHEAVRFASRMDVGYGRRRALSQQLFNATNANF